MDRNKYLVPKLSEPLIIKSISTDYVRILLEPYEIDISQEIDISPQTRIPLIIPKGFVTDGHTYSFLDVFFEGFLGGRMDDKFILSSLVHDYLYVENESLTRYNIDLLYYKLRNYELERPILHGMCFIGVRLVGWILFRRFVLGETAHHEDTGLDYKEFYIRKDMDLDTLDIVALLSIVIMFLLLVSKIIYNRLYVS